MSSHLHLFYQSYQQAWRTDCSFRVDQQLTQEATGKWDLAVWQHSSRVGNSSFQALWAGIQFTGKPAVCYLEHRQWLVANTAAATDQPKSRCGFHPWISQGDLPLQTGELLQHTQAHELCSFTSAAAQQQWPKVHLVLYRDYLVEQHILPVEERAF